MKSYDSKLLNDVEVESCALVLFRQRTIRIRMSSKYRKQLDSQTRTYLPCVA